MIQADQETLRVQRLGHDDAVGELLACHVALRQARTVRIDHGSMHRRAGPADRLLRVHFEGELEQTIVSRARVQTAAHIAEDFGSDRWCDALDRKVSERTYSNRGL